MQADAVREDGGRSLRYGTAAGWWAIVTTVLGSGVAFLDGTVVNVALPAIARDLDTGLSGLQWTVDAYLLTLGSLIVLGGSLGDLYGRRKVFIIGLAAFTVASLVCGLAPSTTTLIAARALQGVGGALLVPGSLAILSASFDRADRARAVGAWSGLSGVWTAVGPFLGGWLVDAFSWRWVFFINLPVAAFTIVMALRHLPETRDEESATHVDWLGAVLTSVGLGGVVYALIEGPAHGWSPLIVLLAVVGPLSLLGFVLAESRSRYPMVPLSVFRSSQFTGANLTTLAVYAALGASTFLLIVHLQRDLHYSALEAGVAFLPATAILLLFSSRAGALAQRIGARWPMTFGPLLAALGLLLLARIGPGSDYLTVVLPGVLVLGAGLTLTVAPLTSAVLAAVEDRHMGVGSAINNAVARIASLLAVAVLPGVSGLSSAQTPAAFSSGYSRAMVLAAILTAAGGIVAALTIRRDAPVTPTQHAHVTHACQHPAPYQPPPGGVHRQASGSGGPV